MRLSLCVSEAKCLLISSRVISAAFGWCPTRTRYVPEELAQVAAVVRDGVRAVVTETADFQKLIDGSAKQHLEPSIERPEARHPDLAPKLLDRLD